MGRHPAHPFGGHRLDPPVLVRPGSRLRLGILPVHRLALAGQRCPRRDRSAVFVRQVLRRQVDRAQVGCRLRRCGSPPAGPLGVWPVVLDQLAGLVRSSSCTMRRFILQPRAGRLSRATPPAPAPITGGTRCRWVRHRSSGFRGLVMPAHPESGYGGPTRCGVSRSPTDTSGPRATLAFRLLYWRAIVPRFARWFDSA